MEVQTKTKFIDPLTPFYENKKLLLLTIAYCCKVYYWLLYIVGRSTIDYCILLEGLLLTIVYCWRVYYWLLYIVGRSTLTIVYCWRVYFLGSDRWFLCWNILNLFLNLYWQPWQLLVYKNESKESVFFRKVKKYNTSSWAWRFLHQLQGRNVEKKRKKI